MLELHIDLLLSSGVHGHQFSLPFLKEHVGQNLTHHSVVVLVTKHMSHTFNNLVQLELFSEDLRREHSVPLVVSLNSTGLQTNVFHIQPHPTARWDIDNEQIQLTSAKTKYFAVSAAHKLFVPHSAAPIAVRDVALNAMCLSHPWIPSALTTLCAPSASVLSDDTHRVFAALLTQQSEATGHKSSQGTKRFPRTPETAKGRVACQCLLQMEK